MRLFYDYVLWTLTMVKVLKDVGDKEEEEEQSTFVSDQI